MNEKTTQGHTPFESDLIEIVVQFWQAGRPITLAKLGQTLTSRGYRLRGELGGKPMAQFIAEKLSGHVRAVRVPSSPLDVVAAPWSVPESEVLEALSKPKVSDPQLDLHTATPRFNRVVWLAFSRPIASGFVRTLSLHPKPNYQDVSTEAALASGKFRIEEKDLPANEVGQVSFNSGNVSKAIEAWAKKIGQPLDILYSASTKKGEDYSSAGGSLLVKLLDTLSQDELQAVNLPLNVVKKLLNSY